MITLLIGGTVVLCVGLLTIVFGVPIKEFSFGNTMILAGTMGACAGLILIGLYFVGREFRNMTRRLETGLVVPARDAAPEQPKSPRHSASTRPHPGREDALFARDQPDNSHNESDNFSDDPERLDPARSPATSAPLPSWPDQAISRSRNPASLPEPLDPAPAERPRRNIMFSSKRREPPPQELPPLDLPPADHGDDRAPAVESFQHRDSEFEADRSFDQAWPGSDKPSRQDSDFPHAGRPDAQPDDAHREPPESGRERFPSPRRGDASSVTIVKSGVVDSMAYSLYSDGSIEAQMPEGMVRFVSIDELRSHLDQRG
ncbi:MAG: hypothetical protein V4661_09790 [Pseudomonadota bacterium]